MTAPRKSRRPQNADERRRLSIRRRFGEVKVLVGSPGLKRWESAPSLEILWRTGKPQGELPIPLIEFKVPTAEVANKAVSHAPTVTSGYGYARGPLARYAATPA